MSVRFRGKEVQVDLAGKVGQVLLRMAILCQTEGKRRMNTSNRKGENPSRPGEWLHKGTGLGQAGLSYHPATPAEVAAQGSVRLGWVANSWYMGYWGLELKANRRKSLVDLVDELRPQLTALAAGG